MKQINTRITSKHDIEALWENSDFVPLFGEIVVYDAELLPNGTLLQLPSNRTVPYTYPRLKIGDGVTPVGLLPFIGGLDYTNNAELFFNCGTAAEYIPEVVERLEGDGQEYYTMAPSTLSFRSTAPLNELQNVTINGQVIDPSNYEIEEGSTIVKLPVDYLKTLNVGCYEIGIESTSKTAKGNFTVAAPELNEYGFYYDHPYYINGVDVGGAENSVILSGAFIISTNNTVYVLDVEADALFEETLTCENNIYTFKFLGATVTGAFTSNGASFVTSEVFIAGGGWMPDYSGNDRVEFTLNTEAICGDGEYVYFYSNSYDTLVALPVNNKKSYYNLPKIHIRDNAVTGFAPSAFSSNTELTSITIPSGFTSVFRYTFEECSSLASVMIPNTVTIIQDYAFSHCTSLTSITIPDSVTSIGEYAFNFCTSLISVTIPNSVTSIGKWAFNSCSITSITIPDSVTSIGDNAFASATLANITFKGTISQWNAITKEDGWNYNVPATYVQCSDGQVAL